MRIANARAASPLRPTPYTKSFFADVKIPTASEISFDRSTERIFARWSRRYAVDAMAVVASGPAGAPRVHVGEVQDRQHPFRVLDQSQELVEATDDFGAAARLDPQP